jgi:hypothetical protein
LNGTAQPSSSAPLKLNLGSGQNPKAGYVNVDRFGSPDVKWDLEQIPWPWPDDSVEEVVLHHVLEHLGQAPGAFFGIIRELYRVCRNGASIHITVPHPRHDEFLSDPTHVRAFTPESFALYSKDLNRLWQEKGCANSPLGLYLDVDFVIASLQLDLDPPWLARLRSGELTEQQITQAAAQYNNVIRQFRIRLVARKPSAPGR